MPALNGRHAGTAARSLHETSYAEAAQLCEDVERQVVLHPDKDPVDLFRQRLALWTQNNTSVS